MADLEAIVYVHPPLLEKDFSQYEHYTYISEETVMYNRKENDNREILILERATKDGNSSALVPGFIVNYKIGKNLDDRDVSHVIPVPTAERLEVAEFLRGLKKLGIDCANLYFINNDVKVKKMSGKGGFPVAAI